MKNKQKLLILGSSGFIGKNLTAYYVDNFSDEYDIYCTYNNSEINQEAGITPVKVNLLNPNDVDNIINGMDIVIQAAATTSGVKDIVSKPYYHVTDNAVMNSYIFKSAYEHEVKHLIFFSCTVMYPPNKNSLTEHDVSYDNIHPRYFGVAWTKLYCEKLCQFYSELGRTKFTVLRHSNIYGPHDKFDLERSHFTAANITKVMTCKDGYINVWGDGTEKRDLLYIDDLLEAIRLAILNQSTQYALYNIGSGYAISVRDVVHKIIEISERSITPKYDLSKPTIKSSLYLNCQKALNEIKWKPQISLNEGLIRTIEWYKEYLT